ncbi:cellulose biosynthesis cyclic di-GMP-binding regulatory protein BcsB [Photobacterium makurazakiensis]|uniref:cellulose biosynthesis cyclic di-GMP-binding regulatory protein BcsB n=1 Tax=Photobacterium makurazakiensis TaxID=2910234 RepID=UPI003D12588A
MKRFITVLMLLLFTGVSQAETTKVPLSFILPDSQDTTLRGQWDKTSFPLAILENQLANNVKVTLKLAHSGNIDTANLWLHLGEKPLANIQLQAKNESQEIVATLTSDLLQRYGNILTLSIRHQLPPSLSLTQQRIEASEAVTKILTEQSYYEIDYQYTGVQPTLSNFSALMRSGQLHKEKINLNNLLDANSDTALSVAGMLVQGWTLRSGTDAYQFEYHQKKSADTQTFNGKINLLYGLPEALAQSNVLPNNFISGINGPYLGFHFAPKTQQWFFIVSGRNNKELVQAAQYFTNPTYRLPNHTYALVDATEQSEQIVLASNQQYNVNTLTSQQQFGDSPLAIPLMMPANMLVNKGDTADINLMLNHPKVLPGEAAMVLRINDEYANSMPLRSSYWRDSQHYRLSFPMDKLRSGLNTISIELYGPEQMSEFNQGENYLPFIAKISESSTLKLGTWVNYYSVNKQQLHAEQLLFATADHGINTQLSLNFEHSSELTAVWQLLSHVVLQARQPMEQLLITTATTAKRPVQLMFNVGNTTLPTTTTAQNTDRVTDTLRQHLLTSMVNSSQSSISEKASPTPLNQYGRLTTPWQNHDSHTLARLSTSNNGWRKIEFNARDDESLNKDMLIYLSDDSVQAPGKIALALPSHESDIQLARAGFITHPYSLPAILFALIFPLVLLVQRGLEARR